MLATSNMLTVLLVVAIFAGWLGALPTSKIFESSEESISERPYQVSLHALGQFYCSGVIISEAHVVTTATCLWGPGNVLRGHEIDPLRYQLRAGSNNTAKGGDVYQVMEVIVHEQFDLTFPLTPDFDIAVLKVATSFVFGSRVEAVVPLPSNPSYDSIFVTTGWGQTSITDVPGMKLFKIRVQGLDQHDCVEAFVLIPEGHVTARMFCSLTFVSEGDGPKLLDLGGPITLDNKLLGLTSGGTPGTPRTYTNTIVLGDWIRDHTGPVGAW